MDARWQHPFTAIIAGPTSSGKSFFIKRLLKEIKWIINGCVEEIIYCIPEGQVVDREMTYTKLFEGIPDVSMFS